MYQSLMLATPEELSPLAIAESQAPALPDPSAQAQSRRARMDSLLARLEGIETGDIDNAVAPDSTNISEVPSQATEASISSGSAELESAAPVRAIIDRLETVMTNRTLPSASPTPDSPRESLARGLLSRAEYEDIVLSCVRFLVLSVDETECELTRLCSYTGTVR